MENRPITFKAEALALALTTGLFTLQASFKTYANEVPKAQRSCIPSTKNNSRQCETTQKTQSEVKNVHPAESTASIQKELDWVPLSKLSKEQRAKRPSYICGAYIEPDRPGKNFKGNPNTQPIIAEADHSNYDQSIATLTGNVTIQQANRQFKSDTATFNKEKNLASFKGHARIREPGLLIVGDRGKAQMNTGEATVENATYVEHANGHRGHASTMTRTSSGIIHLTHATYTSCPPDNTGWLLSGKNVTLDPATGFGSAHDATIRVEGLPIFYAPYLYFPIDDRRQSGFLFPSIGSSSENGLDISLPYYFNLAPNYDATLTPRFLSKRGMLLELEGRYLTEKSKGTLGIAALAGKDQLKNENPYYDKERWLINWENKTHITPKWSVNVDYANASDKNYLDDFSSNLQLSSSSVLNQLVSTHYIGGDANHDWQFSLAAQKYKNMSQTADDPYNKLPEATLNGHWFSNNHFTISYLADYTRFSRSDNWHYVREEVDPNFDPSYNVNRSIYDGGYGIERAEGNRMYLETGVSMPFRANYGFITPDIKLRNVQYQLSNLDKNQVIADLNNAYGNFTASDYTESPKTTVPTFSLDSGLYFDREVSFGSTHFDNTFEPRMKYLYVPYVNQEMNPIFDTRQLDFSYNSLWRDNRFSGYDRLGDANQLSLGFTTRLLENNGFERLRFSMGQIIYFQDRKVYISPKTGSKDSGSTTDSNDALNRLKSELSRPTSPLASELIYNINQTMKLSQNLAWDTSSNRMDNYNVYYRYQPTPQKVFNIGYGYREQADRYTKNAQGTVNPTQLVSNNLSQTDISFAMPITNRWSGMGRWQYDLTNKRNLELLTGVEYSSCCYQVRLLWRSWVDVDDNIDYPTKKTGVFLQFVLRGLGGLSSGPVTEYLSGISGYNTEHEK